MAYVSIAEAVRLTGKSRSTISRKINNGGLSKTSEGIDTSELIRVFGDIKGSGDVPLIQSDDSPVTNPDTLQKKLDEQQRKISELEEKLESERNDAKNERDRFLSIIENRLTHDDTQNVSTKPTKTGFWSKLFK
jgi:hypothetical protein